MSTVVNHEFIVPLELSGKRVDQILAQLLPEHSRSRLTDWIKDGSVTVNGNTIKPKEKLWGGEQINLHAEVVAETDWAAQPIELDIVYEDDALIVINKPVGLVVHPGAGNPDGTLVNALLHHDPSLSMLPRCGIVHRLDKDTSGLLVIAKTLPAHTSLVAQLQDRSVSREYVALVVGYMIAGKTIDAPIGRHPQQRKKMAHEGLGKEAITHVTVAEHFDDFTLVNCKLETGRTHQIRVHMAHIRHPLVGDPVYGQRLKLPAGASDELIEALRGFKRQALHAQRLSLKHPVTGETISWTAPIPQDMENLLEILRG